jgi:hypothetical protein
LNGLVAVRFFDFLTHIVEDPKKAQQRSATTSISSSSSAAAAAAVEVVVEETSAHSSSSDASSSAADGNGGVISFEEAKKREKSREKSLLAAVGSSPSSSGPKKKVQEHLYSSPYSVLMTAIPACSAKVSKGWLSPLGPPKVKASARVPFVSQEAAKIEKEMQTTPNLSNTRTEPML